MIFRIFKIPKYFAPDCSTLQIVIWKKTFLLYKFIDTVLEQNCDVAVYKHIFKVFENSQRFLRTDGLTDLYRLTNQQSDALVICNQITTKISHMLVFRFFRCPWSVNPSRTSPQQSGQIFPNSFGTLLFLCWGLETIGRNSRRIFNSCLYSILPNIIRRKKMLLHWCEWYTF